MRRCRARPTGRERRRRARPPARRVRRINRARTRRSAPAGSGIQNGLVMNNLHGFKVYMSNNLPAKGTGPATAAASNTSNYGVIVSGHSSAIATAEQINKTETYRDPDNIIGNFCKYIISFIVYTFKISQGRMHSSF